MFSRCVRNAIFIGSDTSATYSTASDVTYSCVEPGNPYIMVKSPSPTPRVETVK